VRSKRRWSFYDPDAPPRLYNRDVKVDDLMLDAYGDFYRCTQTSEEYFSEGHGTHVIAALKFVSLTSEGFRNTYSGHAGREVDDCWIWHCRVGPLV